MNELLQIFNASKLSEETRIKLMIKMIGVLDGQMGMNLYEEIVLELINTFDSIEDFKHKYKDDKKVSFIFKPFNERFK